MSASTSTTAAATAAAAAAAPSRSSKAARRRLSPALLLALAALLPARGASAQAGGCPISMTFFPPGTANLPTAWSKANQTAAGNARDDALLPIALYGVPEPVLNAAALSPVLGAPGTLVPDACAGAAATTRRRSRSLKQAGGGSALAVPATYSFAWSVDGNASVIGQGGPAVDADGSPVFPKIALSGANSVWNMADGPHTLTLTMVVAAGSGSLADGTRVPAAPLTVQRTAVFYKMTNRPTATVAFNTCTPAFGVQMTNMWPEAVPLLDQDGAVVPATDGLGGAAAFLKPVYHVWGRFQSGLNGEAFTGEDSEHSNEWHFFDRYFVRELGAPDRLLFDKDDLVQGYYELSVEGSITSDYPSLVALAGADEFGQEGTVYSSVGSGGLMTDTDLAGRSKFNGAFVAGLNGTRVGVQKAKTALLALAGPGAPPAVGETVALSWAFQGLGNTTCALDGVARGNSPQVPSPPGACVSPYSVTIADALNHTFAVSFKDVCGDTRTETLVYGAGREWSTTAQLDGLAGVDSALALQDPMLGAQGGEGGRVLGRARNGAAGVSPALGGGVGAAAAAAALVLLLA